MAEPKKYDADELVKEGRVDAPDHGKAVSDYFTYADIFKRVLATADEELERSNLALFLSAVGAGATLGLTFLARVILTLNAGETEPGTIGNLLYSIGFIVIILGRYQLYTENTLTPVLLVLTRLARLRDLLRIWVVVFVGNMIGAIAFAAVVANTTILTSERAAAALNIGRHASHAAWADVFWRGVMAGVIMAATVWLVHSTREAIGRVVMIFVMMYLVGIGGFFHVITSSVEVFYYYFHNSSTSFLGLFWTFVAPVLLGNTIGGVLIVALLHYAQFAQKNGDDVFSRYQTNRLLQDGVEKSHSGYEK